MCLDNNSKDSQLITWKNELNGLNEYVYNFSVDYDIIETSNIIDIFKYLMKIHDIS